MMQSKLNGYRGWLVSIAVLVLHAPASAETVAIIGTGDVARALGPRFAELIQGSAPGAHVVKAFNTLNWRTMEDPASAGGPVSIPLVGDSAEAKATVAKLVEGIGLVPIDLGPIHHARIVEGMLILWINNRFVDNRPFEFHLREVQSR